MSRRCPDCGHYAICDRTLRPTDPRITALQEVEPDCAGRVLDLANTVAEQCEYYSEAPVNSLPPSP